MKLRNLLLPAAALTLLLSQCTFVEPDPVGLSLVDLESQGKEGSRGSLQVQLDGRLPSDLEIYFEVKSDGAYFYDFEVKTPSPLIIPAGSLRGEIEFTTIDDGLMEARDEKIEFDITRVSDAEIVLPSAANLTYTYTILDNDIPSVPTSGVRMYLTWDAASASFNDANLDLILSYDVGDGNVQPLSVSDRTQGFEELSLLPAGQDGDYYLSVRYNDALNSLNNEVEYTLVFAAANQDLYYVTGFFLPKRLGETDQIVKMVKSGNTYTYSLLN